VLDTRIQKEAVCLSSMSFLLFQWAALAPLGTQLGKLGLIEIEAEFSMGVARPRKY
jgi:hypothetical protein